MRLTARAVAAAALLLCAAAARSAPPEPASADTTQEAPQAAPGEDGAASAAASHPAAELRERLAAREHELAALRGELERLKAKNAAAALPLGPPPPVADPAPAAARVAGPSAGPAPPGVADDLAPPLIPLPGTRHSFPPWQVATGAALGALLLGFALGWHTLDRRIRRKYGGLRIY